MIEPTNLRAFRVRFIGPSDFKGSRCAIDDLRFNETVRMSKDHSKRGCADQALDYLKGRGIEIAHTAEAGNDVLLLSPNFNTPLKGNLP